LGLRRIPWSLTIGALLLLGYSPRGFSSRPGRSTELCHYPDRWHVIRSRHLGRYFSPLSLLAERFGFRRWWRIVTLLTFALTGIVVVASLCFSRADGQPAPYLPILLCASLTLYVISGFFVYLSCIA